MSLPSHLQCVWPEIYSRPAQAITRISMSALKNGSRWERNATDQDFPTARLRAHTQPVLAHDAQNIARAEHVG